MAIPCTLRELTDQPCCGNEAQNVAERRLCEGSKTAARSGKPGHSSQTKKHVGQQGQSTPARTQNCSDKKNPQGLASDRDGPHRNRNLREHAHEGGSRKNHQCIFHQRIGTEVIGQNRGTSHRCGRSQLCSHENSFASRRSVWFTLTHAIA